MKLSKTFGRVATTLVAAAMMASLAVVPAAAEVQPAQSGTDLTTVKIEKLLYMPEDVTTPTQTFTFEITGATATEDTINIDGTNTRNLYSGVVGEDENVGGSVEVKADYDDQNRDASDEEGIDVYTAEVTLTLPSKDNFDKAGVYKYDIKEAAINDGDFSVVTENGLDLYLIVERENPDTEVNEESDTYKITGAFIYADGATYDTEAEEGKETDAKTAQYENNYKLDESGSTVGTLTFSKTINGAMGSSGDKFDFTVTGTENDPLTPDDVYNYERTGSEPATGTVKVGADGTLSFQNVTGGDTITIKGLDKGSYTVTEAENNMGYDVSYKVGKATDATEGSSADVNVEAQKTAAVEFINTRDAVSPTGLVMDIAPYALLVVVAAVGCFVFLRKRRED